MPPPLPEDWPGWRGRRQMLRRRRRCQLWACLWRFVRCHAGHSPPHHLPWTQTAPAACRACGMCPGHLKGTCHVGRRWRAVCGLWARRHCRCRSTPHRRCLRKEQQQAAREAGAAHTTAREWTLPESCYICRAELRTSIGRGVSWSRHSSPCQAACNGRHCAKRCCRSSPSAQEMWRGRSDRHANT